MTGNGQNTTYLYHFISIYGDDWGMVNMAWRFTRKKDGISHRKRGGRITRGHETPLTIRGMILQVGEIQLLNIWLGKL